MSAAIAAAAREAWTLEAVDFRGGVVGELDVKVECADGRNGIITVSRWPAGWRVPEYLNLPPAIARGTLRIARECEHLGAIA